MAGFTGWHLLLVLAIVLLLFGAPRLPALAKSLGQSMKIFKSEIKTPEDQKKAEAQAADGARDSYRPDTAAPPTDSPWGGPPSSGTPHNDSANTADTNPKP